MDAINAVAKVAKVASGRVDGKPAEDSAAAALLLMPSSVDPIFQKQF